MCFASIYNAAKCNCGRDCPIPLWGSLQRSPDTLAAFKGRDGPVVGKGKEMRKGKEQKSRGGEVRGVGTGPPIG